MSHTKTVMLFFLVPIIASSMPAFSKSDDLILPKPFVRREHPASTAKTLNIEAAFAEEGHGDDAVANADVGVATSADIMRVEDMPQHHTQASCVDNPARRRSGKSCEWLSGVSGTAGLNWCKFKTAGDNPRVSGKPGGPKPGEATEFCCASCAAAPSDIAIGFGGETRSDTEMPMLLRPEELKFSQCLATGCQECKSSTNCWFGQDLNSLGIKVAAASAFSYFRAAVTTKCPVGSKAFWQVMAGYVGDWKNGYLIIQKDNVVAKKSEGVLRSFLWRDDMHSGTNNLQVDFHPHVLAKPSSVTVQLSARRADVQFEDCFDAKNCLNVLGDGSVAGFRIRNVNENQLTCLEEGQMPNEQLTKKCKEWIACVKRGGKDLNKRGDEDMRNLGGKAVNEIEGGMKATPGEKRIEFLKAFLRAAGTRKKTKSGPMVISSSIRGKRKKNERKSSSAAGTRGKRKKTKRKSLFQGSNGYPKLDQKKASEGCIDPSIADAEAMECDCMQELVDECGKPLHAGTSDEDCFAKLLCTRSNVHICQDWKNEHCGEYSQSLYQKQQTSLSRRSGRANESDSDDMDDTLRGKCLV